MAQRYPAIPDALRSFITQQKIFFVATAEADGRVNLSPKGLDSLRIVDNQRVVWLNLTGSGNETAAHIPENSRMTLMFMAMAGTPMILRLYGNARVIHQNDAQWQELFRLFDPIPGARQIFNMTIDLVQTSCGMGVPLYEYRGERDQLTNWALKKGSAGLMDYWREKNQISLDDRPTHILRKNT